MPWQVLLLAGTWAASNMVLAQQSVPLERALRSSVTINWEGPAIGDALQRLAEIGGVPLWRDRRVDPQRTVSLRIVNRSLGEAFEQLAAAHDLGITSLGEVIYVGPKGSEQELPAVLALARQQLSSLSATDRRGWLQASPTSWPQLSEPRVLVVECLKQIGCQVTSAEQIPHDLWPQVSLPALPRVEQLAVILYEFDLTFQLSHEGKQCEIVPLQRPLKPARSRTLSRPKQRSKAKQKQQFSLKLENQPLGKVLEQLGSQLQLEIVWPETEEPLHLLRVSCDVTSVELDGLLHAILSSANLRHEIEGRKVLILQK